jgi:hypothetical protein
VIHLLVSLKAENLGELSKLLLARLSHISHTILEALVVGFSMLIL